MKRLLLTCTDLMAIQFLVPHVKYLSAHGFSVELACSDVAVQRRSMWCGWCAARFRPETARATATLRK